MIVLDQATSSHLDYLLDQVCRALQLSATHHEDARQKYEAVADWFSRDGSQLAHLMPTIYPQGSVRIGTTVLPHGHEEYDLDLVLQLETRRNDAMGLYEAVYGRLHEHQVYRTLLERKNRCLRLNYAGQFHMDVLPARLDYDVGGNGILVPDRELRKWKASNPEGFARWFLGISQRVYQTVERDTIPLPEPEDADEKSPLQRAVQILKRRRDIYFNGNEDNAPRSIVLTTLAAQQYGNEQTVLDTLSAVLVGISAEIARRPGIMVVPNPTRTDENFAEAWTEDSYAHFVNFIIVLRQELEELENLPDTEAVGKKLEAMFGEDPTQSALRAYGDHLRRRREVGRLRVGRAGLTTAGVAHTRPVPNHRFFGSPEDR